MLLRKSGPHSTHLLSVFFAGFIALHVTACSQKETQAKYLCDLPADQKGSLLNPVESAPVTLLVDEAWSEREIQAIESAAKNWNQSSDSVLHHSTFQVVSERRLSIRDRSLSAFRDCSKHSALQAGGSVIPVIRSESEEWKDFDSSQELRGITFHCDRGDKNVSRVIVMKPMDLITEADSKETNETVRNQFQSAVTHELGHSLGLDHSCNSNGNSSDYIGCEKIDISHTYGQAVMYPYLNVPMKMLDNGDTVSVFSEKTKPNQNDELRLSCQFPH